MIDARGYSCPMPVVMVQNEVKKNAPDTLDVLVDSQTCVENVTRFGEKQGLQVYRLDNANSHGLINRFSSALAVYLNQGKKMGEALAKAQDFINVELVRQSNLQGRSSELYNQFISQVNNFCRTYSDVHFYADQLNVSGRYLAQVTRRISGKTPKAIIDEYIVKEIERELSTTTHTVQEIANTFGFSSQAHLTKFFKKMRGVTPSAFRQKG